MEAIIHQIWIGPEPMPVRERYFTRDLKAMNPSWEYKLWTDAPTLPTHIQEVYDIFGKDGQYAFQADLLRMFLIKEYGGMYVDVDFQPLKPLDDFLSSDTLFCQWNDLILNGVFGASKNHPAIEQMCEAVNLQTTWYGPSWFTKQLESYEFNSVTLEYLEEHYIKHHALHSWGKEKGA